MSCAVPLHSALVLLNLAAVVMCPQLQNPGNGSVTLSMDTLEMSTATYSCNFGFVQIAGNTSRTCQVDRSWSGDAPICQCKLDHEVLNLVPKVDMCTQFNCLQTNMLAALLYNYVESTEQPSITCHLSMA